MSAALLIIDVQHALAHGAEACADADRIIASINVVSDHMRKGGATVVVIQHEEPNSPFEFGSEQWQLARGLVTASSDLFVRKRASDSFHQTSLHDDLQARGVTELVICGMQSDFCVDSTTRRALALGYPVTLIADGHTTVGNAVLSAAQISAHHTATLCNLTSFGPRVTARAAADLAAL